MRLLGSGRSGSIEILKRLFGDSATSRHGIFAMRDSASGESFSLVHLVPFTSKERGALGKYRLGWWPSERQKSSYENPEGFIEVTRENQDTYISERFRLRDFLTKDQQNVWPKYLVLREDLIDKLELVMDDLESRGIRAGRMQVLSGFRTPQYNVRGVRGGGRALDSRHQYGDAADVFVDVDGNGRMDDLNRDGKVNSADTKILAAAVERVERAYPDLVGGVGLYRSTRSHGPFVHVDVRGYRARWGRA